jgi:alpha-L-fucosidase
MRVILRLAAVLFAIVPQTHADHFEPTWESLDTRPNPQWYDAARFGIKIHWGPYAVPAYGALGQYAEQYARWYRVGTEGCGTTENPISSGCETARFHRSTYGSMPYEEFYSRFNPVLYNASQWAETFRRGGARTYLKDLYGKPAKQTAR